jgi:predicted membrane chloride channel (bestrophin family)
MLAVWVGVLAMQRLARTLPRVAPAARMSTVHDSAAEARSAVESLWSVEVGPKGTILVGDADQTALGVRISKDSTITKLWTSKEWENHMNALRFFRHLLYWPRSTVVRSLLPILSALAGWTLLVYFLKLKLPLQALGLSVSPLALLLAFRVNAATARFSEARTQWGRSVLHSRDAASILATVHTMPVSTRALCCRLLCSYGWAMKAVLRSETNLRDLLDALLPADIAEWIASQRKPPLGILALLRQLTANMDANHATAQSLAVNLSELNGCYGGMERIYATPLSPTYMRHTTRGLLLWLAMLPAGLLGAGVTTAHSMIAVLSTAYIMLGIEVSVREGCGRVHARRRVADGGELADSRARARPTSIHALRSQEIGIQIEQPFDCLPLHGLSRALTLDVLNELFPEKPLPDEVLRHMTPGLTMTS